MDIPQTIIQNQEPTIQNQAVTFSNAATDATNAPNIAPNIAPNSSNFLTPIGDQSPAMSPRALPQAPESIHALRPSTTLARSLTQLGGQIQEQLHYQEPPQQRAPLARIHFCAYPGRSMFSRGHSFVAIEPLDSQLAAGNIKMGTQSYLGTVAVGVSPKDNNTGDRITDCFSLRTLLGKPQDAQLRNDIRYLQKPNTRSLTMEIFDEQQLQAGLEHINQLSFDMNNEPEYMKSINALPVAPARALATPQQSLRYDFKHNSNDYALDIFKHFCEGQTLPPALLNRGSRRNSQQMWKSLREPFQNQPQPQPQTLGVFQLLSAAKLRRTAPSVIAQAQRLVGVANTDMHQIQREVDKVKTILMAMQQRYQPHVIAVLNELMDDAPEQANIFGTVMNDFSKAIEDAAKVAEQLQNPHSFLEVATTVVSSVFDADSRNALLNAITSFSQVINTGKLAMDKINSVTDAVPNADIELQAFGEDLKRLMPPAITLLQTLVKMPDRVMLYLESLNSVLTDAGKLFLRPPT